MRRLTENSQGDMVITFPLGPFKSLATLVVGTGAQMSALQIEVAIHCGVKPDKKKIWVTYTSGKSQLQCTAQVKCWLSGDKTATEAVMVVEALLASILGLDLSKGHAWTDVRERERVFGLPSPSVPLQ